MDFGCGTGAAFPVLRERLGAREVVGVDVSRAELEIARRDFPWARACGAGEFSGTVDVCYSNGTFHHILPGERQGALAYVRERLRPGGILGLWENNPWNPGTRWVMSRIAFDRDAITLSCLETKWRMREAGFEVLRTDFWFVFPRALKFLRGMERGLCRLPMGAQYQVLGLRK